MAKHPGGRPTDYDKKICDEICQRITNGESLRAIVEDDHMPNRSTIHLWLLHHDEFSDQYAKAREYQADTLADELIYLADTAEDVNKARLQVDTRKWVASKLKPKKYSDKIDLTSDGEKIQPLLVKIIDEKDAGNSN